MVRTNSQAQTGVNLTWKLNLTLKVKVNQPQKTIDILTKFFYTYGPNLVILAWTGNKLSHGQTWLRTDGRTNGLTDGWTDTGNDNTRRPKLALGKNQETLAQSADVNRIQLKCVSDEYM